jgi:hypothetical protein
VLRPVLLAILAAVLTVTLQRWVGSLTIYSPELAEKRLKLHEAILHNRPPDGESWVNSGASRTNVRIFTVYLAEGMKQATGMGVLRAYLLLDTVAMVGAFLLLFAHLRSCVPAVLSLVGVLYFGFASVLTYHLHYFHPWDRLSTLCWLIAIMLVRANRFWGLLALLPVGVSVKWDIAAVPGLYALAQTPIRWEKGRAARTVALAVTAGAVLIALNWALPGGGRDATAMLSRVPRQLALNWQQVVELNLGYPPILTFALPVILAGIGLRDAPWFDRASCGFAAALSVTLLLLSNFAEVRAHMMILILLLPTALIGLARVAGGLDSAVAEPR